MLVKLASALLLVLELLKYSFQSSPNRSANEFYHHVFTKLSKGSLPEWSRPYACVFALSTALSQRAYDAALSMLHAPNVQFPWSEVSGRLLRKIFEVALIFGDRPIAQLSLRETALKPTVSATVRDRMDTLLRWRFEGLLASEAAAAVTTAGLFFENFPEYDEYFKGSAYQLQGNAPQAKFHFERSLVLAPRAALELREALAKRIAQLGP
jgi:hypothetical protein